MIENISEGLSQSVDQVLFFWVDVLKRMHYYSEKGASQSQNRVDKCNDFLETGFGSQLFEIT